MCYCSKNSKYFNDHLLINFYQINMIDDISFIPDTISLVSKLKEPLQNGENSLSRIIREQAINYSEEIPDEDIEYNSSDKFQDQNKDKRSGDAFRKNNKPITFSEKINNGKSPAVFQRPPQSPLKNSPSKERGEKIKGKPSVQEQIRTTEHKSNVLNFEQIENRNNEGTSKKEKRTQKLVFEEQKTKKIDFEDIDRLNPHQSKKVKKTEGTKIKTNFHLEEFRQEQLQITSKGSSQIPFEEKEINIVRHKLTSNYNMLIGQVRQMMTMNRWEYLDLQRVDLKKLISKVEGDIRKIKIGFRGLTQSCESQYKNKSKLKFQDSFDIKMGKKVPKLQPQKSKGKLQIPDKKLDFDYCDSFEPQLSKSCVFSSNINQKMDQLKSQIAQKRNQSNKLASQFNDIMIKYNEIKTKTTTARQNQKMEFNPTPSTINRVKILKEKVLFLKNQIKETKEYYSGRIKRLKNQNSILKNQLKYTDKGVEDLIYCIRNLEKNTKKIEKTIPSNIVKPHIKIFDEKHIRVNKCSEYMITPSKLTITSRDMGSNLLSPEVKSLKSINSIKSVQSIQSFGSKPSLGSITSHKSTKTESIDTNQEFKGLSKPKLKINSPHIPTLPSQNTKQYSIITKRKKQTQMKLNLNSGDRKEKKISSLDVAFKQLQQKYLKQAVGNSQYYSNQVK